MDEEMRRTDEATKGLHGVVQMALADDRLETHSLNIADGFTVCLKK
jgi:predicted O-methyltransferase YrrM